MITRRAFGKTLAAAAVSLPTAPAIALTEAEPIPALPEEPQGPPTPYDSVLPLVAKIRDACDALEFHIGLMQKYSRLHEIGQCSHQGMIYGILCTLDGEGKIDICRQFIGETIRDEYRKHRIALEGPIRIKREPTPPPQPKPAPTIGGCGRDLTRFCYEDIDGPPLFS